MFKNTLHYLKILKNNYFFSIIRKIWRIFYKSYWQAFSTPNLPYAFGVDSKDDFSCQVHRIASHLLIDSNLARLVRLLLFPIKFVSDFLIFRKLRASKNILSGHILLNAWRCAFVNLNTFTYWSYDFNKPEQFKKINEYLFHEEICALLSHLNRKVATTFLDNKREFSQFCTRHALPTPPILAKVGGVSSLQRNVDELPPVNLFVKTENGVCGAGCERWMLLKDSVSWQHQNIVLTRAEMVDYLKDLARQGGVLLQPVLINHPTTEPYSNGSLTTLRVVTCQLPGAPPEVMVCALRMPTGICEVDNFAAGGLAASVSSEGIVGTAVSKCDPFKRINTHPDTNYQFAGTKLPMFEEASLLCLKAHSYFQKPYFVGWDVAFLETGPTLLEANTIWGVNLIQMSHGAPIAKFGFMEKFLHCLDNQIETDGGN